MFDFDRFGDPPVDHTNMFDIYRKSLKPASGNVIDETTRNFWKDHAEREAHDATSLYITAERLATEVGDHELAVELYERAMLIQHPIPGGHPSAMVYAAYHYEFGHGVPENKKRAFDLYHQVLKHPHFGGENFAPTCHGLTRAYFSGVVSESGEVIVEKNHDLARKYYTFAGSNAESQEEVKGLEDWWKKNSAGMTQMPAIPSSRRDIETELYGVQKNIDNMESRLADPSPFAPVGTYQYQAEPLCRAIPASEAQVFASLSPKNQSDAIRTHIIKTLEGCKKRKTRLEAKLMECGDDPSPLNKYQDLPDEISSAASDGKFAKVLKWLGENPSPERLNARCRQKFDRTLLHEAEFSVDLGFMSILLQMGAIVDPRSNSDLTPLSQACMKPKLEPSARLLLEWGADKSWKSVDRGNMSLVQFTKNISGNKVLARLLQSELGGRRCEIHGLVSRPDLNGLAGVAERYVAGKERYVVAIDNSLEKVLVKPANLKRRDRTPQDPGRWVKFENGQFQVMPRFRTQDEKLLFESSKAYEQRGTEFNPLPYAPNN